MDACIVLGVASLAIALLLRSTAFAQTSPAPTDVVATINTANKFQQVLAASGTARRMLRIKNNNTNGDSCWVFTHRLYRRTRSRQPARLAQTPSMSNINKEIMLAEYLELHSTNENDISLSQIPRPSPTLRPLWLFDLSQCRYPFSL
jgi:hypothetical protein